MFFSDTFLPQVNGVATSIANFATELGERGNRVLIVTPKLKEKRPAFTAKNVKVLHLPSVPILVYPNFRTSPFVGFPRALKTVRSFNPDVIHFHTTLMSALDAVLCAKILGKPLIGSNHIYLTKENNSYLSFVAENPMLRHYVTRAVLSCHLGVLSACQVRIAPSQLLIKELRKDGYKKSFEYLPNAVPFYGQKNFTKKKLDALRKRWGVSREVVLHFGRLSAEKRAEDVLRSFAMVKKKRPQASLLLIGDGPDRGRLEELAQDLGIRKSTAFTGFIAPKDLMQSGIMCLGDVFVTASPMEAQGMVIVEAMAFGLPVVAVGEAAVPEVVGDSGFLVRKGDVKAMAGRIGRILSDPALASEMRKKSLERYKLFSIETVTERLLAIYAKAIDVHVKKAKKNA